MSKILTFISKVGKKGVICIPKAAREHVGINENSIVILEADEEKIVIKPLKVLRVRASENARLEIERVLSEEYLLEERKAERLVKRKA